MTTATRSEHAHSAASLPQQNAAYLLWVFTIASVIGYCLEKLFTLLTLGCTYSSKGLLYGPFSQVYGCGAVALTLLHTPLRRLKPGHAALLSGILSGVLEALISWLQEFFFGSVSWHYSGWVLPLWGGRTSLLFMIFWGILSVLFLYCIEPRICSLIVRLDLCSRRVLTLTLALFLGVNIALSALAVQRWHARQNGITPRNGIESWIDQRYPDRFMRLTYPGMRFPLLDE
ncbi:MAG: putative ABC transporter permease [Bacillota bacterium]|nr:putative ABC transporter permease [Bacillota bacterium]